MKLHRYDYENIDGEMKRVRKDQIYLWAGVRIETGEVEMNDLRAFDDELEDLCDGWEWRKLILSDNEKD